MSLPKGQHFEYRVVWDGAFGDVHQTPLCSGIDHAIRLRNLIDKRHDDANARIERRPVGEWEAP